MVKFENRHIAGRFAKVRFEFVFLEHTKHWPEIVVIRENWKETSAI